MSAYALKNHSIILYYIITIITITNYSNFLNIIYILSHYYLLSKNFSTQVYYCIFPVNHLF